VIKKGKKAKKVNKIVIPDSIGNPRLKIQVNVKGIYEEFQI